MAADDIFPTWGESAAQDSQGFDYHSIPIRLIVIVVLAVVLFTRLVSGRNASAKQLGDGEALTPPAVPYYVPFLGHVPNMAVDADGFIKSLRGRFPGGIFSLNFFGGRHNIMYTPHLATALLNQKQEYATSEGPTKKVIENIFGFPREELDLYDKSLPDMMTCYKHIMAEPGLSNMVSRTANNIKNNVADLVTFNESPVDQMLWEKASNVRPTTNPAGEQVVEASLLPLIRDYTAHTVNPVLIGTDFCGNFPAFLEGIWELDRGFMLLGTGLPRWFPIPALTRAHIGRKQVLDNLEQFHEAMEKYWNGDDPGPKWSSLDDVGALTKARMDVYRKWNFSIRARASFESTLMWAGNANSDTLVFWLVVRIFNDRALLEMIREEVAPYVKVTQQESELPIAEAPRLEVFDTEGLCNNCPLLKSCYVECLRVDNASWSFKVIKQDFVLQPREKDAKGWLMRKGDYAHVPHDLHNSNPDYFEQPKVWRADRHVKYEGEGSEKRATADMGSIRPYGGGPSMCKGRAFAFKESMMFLAAIVSMWDIEAAGGGPFAIPKHVRASGVYTTRDDTRVWVKRRKLPKSG